MSIELNIFINRIQRIPLQKVLQMVDQNQEEIQKLSFMNQQAILNFVDKRISIFKNIPREEIMFYIMLFRDLSSNKNMLPRVKASAESELQKLDIMTLIESLEHIEAKTIENMLKAYKESLLPEIIETMIINLPEEEQIKAIEACKAQLMKSAPNQFHNFMASVSKEAQRHILASFEEKFTNYTSEDLSNLTTALYQANMQIYMNKYKSNMLGEEDICKILVACSEENLESTIKELGQQLDSLNADDLMKIICLKTNNSELLFKIWLELPKKLEEVSLPYFKTYIRRLEDKERYEAIYKFKSKFLTMNLDEIVQLFEFDTDEIKAKLLIEYRDNFTGEISPELNHFMTKSVKQKMIEIYAQSQEKEYEEKKNSGIDLQEEFRKEVSSLKDDKRHKLFDEDYIRAIVLARRLLLKDKTINDQDSSYIELRQKYMSHLYKNLRRDNTADESINKSLFYRIVKGNIKFSQLNELETAKALIYLSRSPQIQSIEQIEALVAGMSERQVEGYNTRLCNKLCERIREKYETSKPLEENIQKLALKMFLAFGYDKTLRILEQEISFTSLEYLLNGIRVRNTELNEDGTPRLNEKLMNYLFASNRNDKTANINKILSSEDTDLSKHFSSIYNDWEMLYDKLNGSISNKRILELYKNPVTLLKPDEYRLEEPLQEIGTSNAKVIEKARDWYQIMRERQYSTIPKVRGTNGEYEYEMLDLDDPLALAVGYITRCCFLINGLSSESLYHSISNKNGRTFIVKRAGELIAQSWVWRNGNVLCFDNVETRGKYNADTLLEVYKQASEELIRITEQSENTQESLRVVTYGTSESRMTRAKKMFTEGNLPAVLEKVNYSDAKYEQGVLAERRHTSLYYGEVSARYQDPRPDISEYRDISKMADKELELLNKKLDAIEYTKTGKTRKTNTRKCTYIACSKDWYIAINMDGEVETQILRKDTRAIEECKAKAQEILQGIKKEKIKVPTTFEDVGGEPR